MVEVKGTPFQTDNLTAAQTVKSSQKNYQFDLMPLDDFKQIQDFRIQVVVTLEGFRPVSYTHLAEFAEEQNDSEILIAFLPYIGEDLMDSLDAITALSLIHI